MSQQQPSLAQTACAIAQHGMSVFPLRPRAKTPLTLHGYKDASTDMATVQQWWETYPDANIGIATGAVSGCFVLDIDGDDGEASLRTLEALHGALPPTVEVITGGGGRHLYFQYPNRTVPNSASRIGAGLDIRGDGGYVVAPPSVHESGRAYIRSVDSQTSIVAAPQWLLGLILSPQSREDVMGTAPSIDWNGLIKEGVREGGRNDAMARIAGKLLRELSEPFLAFELCRAVNDARFDPPLNEAELKQTLNSIAQSELKRRGGVK